MLREMGIEEFTIEGVTDVRDSETGREITFRVDSGAYRTVVPKHHPAVRGYRVRYDQWTGTDYTSAGKDKIKDEGRRALV